MSKGWYPVIDYSLCIECGKCIDFCCKGVYDTSKAPTPVVIYPIGCVQGCHGCGRRCPVSAITYVGDTGSSDAGCSCGCGSGDDKNKGDVCDCGC